MVVAGRRVSLSATGSQAAQARRFLPSVKRARRQGRQYSVSASVRPSVLYVETVGGRRTGYWRRAMHLDGTPRTRRSANRQHRSASAAQMTDSSALRAAASTISSSKSITHPYLLAPGLNDEERSMARSLALACADRFNCPPPPCL